MHMVHSESTLGKVQSPRATLASGAAAVALVAAMGGVLVATLSATHSLVGGAFPSIIDIVRAIVIR